VKTLKGDHLARAIGKGIPQLFSNFIALFEHLFFWTGTKQFSFFQGRVAGKGGRTKYTIENVTKTRYFTFVGKNLTILSVHVA
jgi:rRNA processing protein Krr1/Pno1